MIFTDGIVLATDGPAIELHAFAHLIGLNTKWVINHDNPYYEVFDKTQLKRALKHGAKPVFPGVLNTGSSYTVSCEYATEQDVLNHHSTVIGYFHKNILDNSTSQYTREDFLILKNILSNYPNLESASRFIEILEKEEYVENNSKDWVKKKITRLDSEFSFVVDFLKLPYTRIPLVINKYGKEGVAFIILRWRLETGK
jgi:hypothetical protein